MRYVRAALVVLMSALAVLGCSAEPAPRNQIIGTWRMVSTESERNGITEPAYGERPNGMLSFTPDMRFVEVLTDSTVPRFASEVRGAGTDAENRAAMAGSIGMFGTYTVDEDGQFSGNRVEGRDVPELDRRRPDHRRAAHGDRRRPFDRELHASRRHEGHHRVRAGEVTLGWSGRARPSQPARRTSACANHRPLLVAIVIGWAKQVLIASEVSTAWAGPWRSTRPSRSSSAWVVLAGISSM